MSAKGRGSMGEERFNYGMIGEEIMEDTELQPGLEGFTVGRPAEKLGGGENRRTFQKARASG